MIPREWALEFKRLGNVAALTSYGSYPIVYLTASGAGICAWCVSDDIKRGVYGPGQRYGLASDRAVDRGIPNDADCECEECGCRVDGEGRWGSV